MVEVLGVAAGLIWLIIDKENLVGTYWAAATSLAVFWIALFSAAERSFSAHVKAKVAEFLKPQPNAKPIWASQAFLAMLEAIERRCPDR